MTSLPSHPHAPASLAGRWRIDAVLPGAMGSVLIVTDPASGDRFAAKTPRVDRALDAATLRRFEAEARTWLSLGHHENVVEALFLEELDYAGRERPFLFLEYVDGITLDRALEGEGRLALPVVLDVATAAAWGMAHAHGEGREGPRIVHRDLKPENMFLTRDRLVKVSDFGIARALDRPEDHASVGGGLGTPFYSAPEQMKDALSAGPRSDIYSFGAVVHHLLTGQPPFPARTLSELVMRVLREEPPSAAALNPAVPPALDRLLAACLAKTPAGRPSGFGEVLAEVSEIREIDDLWLPSEAARSCGGCGWLSAAGAAHCVICGQDTETGRRYAPVSPRHGGRTPTLGRSGAGSLRVEGIEVRPRVARAGEVVRITLLLGNPGSRPVDNVFVPYTLPDRHAFARTEAGRRGFRGSVPPTAPGAPLRVSWRIRALREGTYRLEGVRVSHRPASGERVTARGEALALRVVAEAHVPFVGREAEIAEIRAALEVARNGAALVAILGRPGTGKTRLGREAWAMAVEAGFETARGRCLGRGLETRGALKEALRKLLGLRRGARGPAETAAAVLALLGRQASRGLVEFLVDELVGVPVARAESPANMWARFAVAVAHRRPFLLVLEDVHRDLDVAHVAIDMAAHAQREGAPFAVLLSGRASLADDVDGVDLLRRLEREPHGIALTRILRLGPLDAAAVARLVDAAFDPNDFETSAPWLAGAVHARTGGNPLFVAELARALRGEARLVVTRDGHFTAAPDLTPEHLAALVPPRTERLILAGLDELPEAARRFVLAAGVLGDAFATSLLAAVLEEPADFGESLATLEAAGVLREVPAEPPTIRFREPVLPEVLRRDLRERDPDAYRRLNAAAASVLGTDADPDGRHALRVARHLEAAGRPADALPLLIGAGWRMARRRSFRQAAFVLAAAERLLAENGLDPEPERRIDLDLLRGEVLGFTGDFEGALAAYARVIEALPDRRSGGATLATAYGRVGNVHQALGRLEDALHCYSMGRSLWRELGDAAGVQASLVDLAELHAVRGDAQAAEAYVEQSLAAGRRAGSEAALGRAQALRAGLQVGRGETAAARTSLRAALRAARAAHDAVTVADAWSVLGNTNARDGRSRAALRFLRRALHLRQEAGDVPGVAAAWNDLGVVQAALGDLTGAASSYERALEAYRRIGSRRGQGTVLANLGRLRREEGRPRQARELLVEAAGAHRDSGDPVATAATLAELAGVESVLGETAAAVETIERATRLAAGCGDHETQARVALARAEAALSGAAAGDLTAELRAAAALPGLTPRLRSSLMALVAELDGDVAMAVEAVRVAAEADDTRTRARALAAEGRVRLANGETEQGTALLRRAAGVLLQSEVRDALLYSVLRDSERALRGADPAAATAAGKRARQLASVLRARGHRLPDRR